MTGRGWMALGSAMGLAVATLAGCRRGPSPTAGEPLMDVFRKQAQEEGLTRTQTDGKRLFATYCVTCHGDTGGGDGQNAYNLDPKPPDFQTSLSAHPRSYWRQIIEGGTASVGRSPLCPPWGHSLTASQIDALLAYLDVLAKPPAGPAAVPRTPKP
jgi:mono/diheme cytochrome c family protein